MQRGFDPPPPFSPNAEAPVFAGFLDFFSYVLLSDVARLAPGKAFALRLLLSAPVPPPGKFSFRSADREEEESAAQQRLRGEEVQERVVPREPGHTGRALHRRTAVSVTAVGRSAL